MTKLNQIIALLNGKKTAAQKNLTEVYKKLDKAELFNGITRKYTPIEDSDTERLPPENKNIQFTVSQAVSEARTILTELFDITLTQDSANTEAKADVVVDGKVIAANVPVTYLLFLEKQITDLRTFVSKLPTLDVADVWQYDNTKDCYVTTPTNSNRSKKVYRNHVKAEATEHHPAQVEMYTEDVKVGEWQTVKLSGAIPAKNKNEMLTRLTKLDDAIKIAREQANSLEVTNKKIGDSIADYVFA